LNKLGDALNKKEKSAYPVYAIDENFSSKLNPKETKNKLFRNSKKKLGEYKDYECE